MATPGSMRSADAGGDVKTEKPSPGQTPRWPSPRNEWSSALAAERDLRDRLASLSHHQEQRRQAIADHAPRRKELETTLAQVDAALEHTRPERVHALAEDPPPYLVRLLGPAPSSPAGQAVWCHHALRIEAFRRPQRRSQPALDRLEPTDRSGTPRDHHRRPRYSKPAIMRLTQSNGPTLPAKPPPSAKRRTGTSRRRERSTRGCHHSRRRSGVPASITLPNHGVPSSACNKGTPYCEREAVAIGVNREQLHAIRVGC